MRIKNIYIYLCIYVYLGLGKHSVIPMSVNLSFRSVECYSEDGGDWWPSGMVVVSAAAGIATTDAPAVTCPRQRYE